MNSYSFRADRLIAVRPGRTVQFCQDLHMLTGTVVAERHDKWEIVTASGRRYRVHKQRVTVLTATRRED